MNFDFVCIRFFQVLLLTGAVASHKFVVSFCLGLELAGVGKSVPKLVFAIFLFAVGSVIGIGIGMLTFQVKKKNSSLITNFYLNIVGQFMIRRIHLIVIILFRTCIGGYRLVESSIADFTRSGRWNFAVRYRKRSSPEGKNEMAQKFAQICRHFTISISSRWICRHLST